MEIALPGLLIILGVIPGIVFWHSHLSAPFSRRVTGISPVLEIALYVLLSVPLDAVGLYLFHNSVGHVGVTGTLQAITGTIEPEHIPAYIEAFEDHWIHATAAYVVLILGASLRHCCAVSSGRRGSTPGGCCFE